MIFIPSAILEFYFCFRFQLSERHQHVILHWRAKFSPNRHRANFIKSVFCGSRWHCMVVYLQSELRKYHHRDKAENLNPRWRTAPSWILTSVILWAPITVVWPIIWHRHLYWREWWPKAISTMAVDTVLNFAKSVILVHDPHKEMLICLRSLMQW